MSLKDQLRAQLDAAIRKARSEGFQAGYEAAVRDLSEATATATAGGVTKASTSQEVQPNDVSKSSRGTIPADYVPRSPRGTNAKIVLEVLRSIAPRAAGPTEIIALVKRVKSFDMPFTSVRHALDQLEKQKGEIEQVDDTKTWRVISKN